MAGQKSIKTRPRHYRIVGVIATCAELSLARRMSRPPDLFEVRLDRLIAIENQLERKMSMLATPLIITARHPAEGGANHLSIRRRRDLLVRFLPQAQYLDVELRSAHVFRALLDLARKNKVRRIISFHDFSSTPNPGRLRAKARAAKFHGADIFKVATRTDTPAQLARLLDFVADQDVDLPASAMGLGKLGAVSRLALTQSGSVLVYASLRNQHLEGQMSLEQLRAALRACGIN
jgi:3-dehydroquinate dehydratase-1